MEIPGLLVFAQQNEDFSFAPPVDLPVFEESTNRILDLGGWNKVICYPNIGGIIINQHITSVELNFPLLSRFEDTSRSSDSNEEDTFCSQLRRTNGKWWASYW
ncbi:hypothetical protein WAI453_003064 [Rhynchosporium graminicola]